MIDKEYIHEIVEDLPDTADAAVFFSVVNGDVKITISGLPDFCCFDAGKLAYSMDKLLRNEFKLALEVMNRALAKTNQEVQQEVLHNGYDEEGGENGEAVH